MSGPAAVTALLSDWKLVLGGMVLAGVVSALGVQTERLPGVRTALSSEQRDRAQENSDRLRAALPASGRESIRSRRRRGC